MDSVFIYIIIVGIFGGFIIGGITGYVAGKKKSKPAEKVMASSLVNANKTTGISDPSSSMESQHEMYQEGYLSLAHLWRRKDEASLSVEVNGVMFPDRSSIPREKIQQLRGVGREWLAWLGEDVKNEQQPDSEPTVNTPISERLEKDSQLEKILLPSSVQEPTFVEAITKKIEITSPHTTFKALSIPEQIDEILQQMLDQSGLGSRNIRITEDIHHNVIFQVDHHNYIGLETVNDQEAAQLIRQAIAEWEKRSKPLHRR